MENTTHGENPSTSLGKIIADCNKDGPLPIRFPMETVVLILAFPANVVLLGLLLKNRRSLTPSEVLGLNFALLGVVFCSIILPLDIGISAMTQHSGLPQRFLFTLTTLSYFGCPLLLTCMCVERYVAVSHPLIFMKLGKWEYRAACSALIWILTCIVATLTHIYSISITALPLSILLILMFLTMVACLLAIIRVLRQRGPGDGEQDTSPIKKRALKNILAVLIPSAIFYLPILALPPFLAIAPMLAQNGTHPDLCTSLNIFSILPNFGVCIGPVFYMGKVRQILCNRNNNVRDTRFSPTIHPTINS